MPNGLRAAGRWGSGPPGACELLWPWVKVDEDWRVTSRKERTICVDYLYHLFALRGVHVVKLWSLLIYLLLRPNRPRAKQSSVNQLKTRRTGQWNQKRPVECSIIHAGKVTNKTKWTALIVQTPEYARTPPVRPASVRLSVINRPRRWRPATGDCFHSSPWSPGGSEHRRWRPAIGDCFLQKIPHFRRGLLITCAPSANWLGCT